MYKFVDIEDSVDAEETAILTRRLREYSPAALKAGAEVERVYIRFPEFGHALDACDRIYQLAKSFTTPQGMVLSGPPGASKTSLAEYFIRSLPPSDLTETGYGAVMFRLRPSPAQGHIVAGLLHAMQYPLTNVKRGRVFQMRDVVFEAMKQRGTRLVFVDHAHCLSTQARLRHADALESSASDTLVEMMDRTKVGLVLLADASFRGLAHVDKALDDRVTVKMSLNHFGEGPLWDGFLAAFCHGVKCVDLSIIKTQAGAALVHSATDGNRRTFRRLITEAVLICVQDEAKVVSDAHLKRAFELTNGTGSTRSNPYGR